ncbi:hypothetical protein N657DRAFT_650450, partial [Parathielavia appendiculata]
MPVPSQFALPRAPGSGTGPRSGWLMRIVVPASLLGTSWTAAPHGTMTWKKHTVTQGPEGVALNAHETFIGDGLSQGSRGEGLHIDLWISTPLPGHGPRTSISRPDPRLGYGVSPVCPAFSGLVFHFEPHDAHFVDI